jgi:hypothetical protein
MRLHAAIVTAAGVVAFTASVIAAQPPRRPCPDDRGSASTPILRNDPKRTVGIRDAKGTHWYLRTVPADQWPRAEGQR